jgi:hypothetical protein
VESGKELFSHLPASIRRGHNGTKVKNTLVYYDTEIIKDENKNNTDPTLASENFIFSSN